MILWNHDQLYGSFIYFLFWTAICSNLEVFWIDINCNTISLITTCTKAVLSRTRQQCTRKYCTECRHKYDTVHVLFLYYIPVTGTNKTKCIRYKNRYRSCTVMFTRLNRCWLNVNLTRKKTLQWLLYQGTTIIIQEINLEMLCAKYRKFREFWIP